MSLDQDLINLIDQRVRSARRTTEAVGTVQGRDTTGPGALVVFDGSTVGVPVKVLGNAPCQPGDRVVLTLYGSDWLVTGGYNSLGYGEAYKVMFPSGATGALTSATFVDLTEVGTVSPFNKFYDNTFVRIGMKVSGYASVADTVGQWAVRLTATAGGDGYTPSDIVMNRIHFNAINQHTSDYHTVRSLILPAGTYTVGVRWRRSSGTGNLKCDTEDQFLVELDERVRASVPVL